MRAVSINILRPILIAVALFKDLLLLKLPKELHPLLQHHLVALCVIILALL